MEAITISNHDAMRRAKRVWAACCELAGASGPPANCELTEESPLLNMTQPQLAGMRMLRLASFASMARLGGILAAWMLAVLRCRGWGTGVVVASIVLVRHC